MGMAFLDTLVTETSATRARVVVVDRNDAPGGHWNAAYPSSGCTSRRRFTVSARFGWAATPSTAPAGMRDSTSWRAPGRFAATTTTSCVGSCCRPGGWSTSRTANTSGRAASSRRPARSTPSASHTASSTRPTWASPCPQCVRRPTRSRPASPAFPNDLPGSPPTTATSSSVPARPASTPACGCWVAASSRND